jgi:histidinol-phosphate aminotransferase
MKNLAIGRIRKMKPYDPPTRGREDYTGLLLDFNERTTGSKMDRLYPEYGELEGRIADYAGTPRDRVMLVNGTDRAIDIVFRTFSDRGDKVIIPEPTFAMYGQYACVNGNRIVSPRYVDGTAFPVDDILGSMGGSTRIVVVCNPNNPTGTLASADDVARIARNAPDTIVYVDEAYFEFSGVTAVGLIDRYPNVIVSRTFSKAFGLAGARIGYVLARPEHVAEMMKVRGPYDISRPACRAVSAVLSDMGTMRAYVKDVMTSAKPLTESFFRESGIDFWPSAANFLLFRPQDPETASLLYDAGISVRPQDKPGVEGTIRLTIGTSRQMRRFISVYRKAMPARKYALIDRDGTLIHEPQDTLQVDRLDRLRVLDGAVEGLKRLQDEGYRLAIVSNQDGVGTDSFPAKDFEGPQKAMLESFRRAGVEFDEVFVCPHLPMDGCACRKPRTGLVDDWLRSVRLDKRLSFVCGDRDTDRAFADNLGLRFVPMPTNGNFLRAISKEIT